MGIRFLLLFSFTAAALSLAPSARADVPTTTSSSAGTGGSASQYNPDCTIGVQAISGTTCVACGSGATACSSLGSDYNFVCNQSANIAIWCNGPDRTIPADQNLTTGCAVSVPGTVWGGSAAGLLAAAAALVVRRRRR